MKTKECIQYFERIKTEIHKNSAKLVELDQAFGDGDLGISMDQGFSSVVEFIKSCEEEDFGKYFMQVSKTFNESAPSSLGTIISFGFMGMAKSMKGITDAKLSDFQEAFKKGLENIKEKTGAKVGDKTIIDSLEPAVNAFCGSGNQKEALHFANEAAKNGMEETSKLIAVHGRAAYHKEKTLGHIDGGAYVSYIIFKALLND
ncbi:dihydroxyacetone kinase subunit DhaL [Anaerorhabdus furcosa]|uniref:phosphoenolpyruvate--glycerone phosphotransferase n=1 Tax=Anaerorhabdus furcosa TaxID=118967 RepID=A0A1T4MFE4_9FIRM|nr:dihydroxyacetone kinase subunit DhaL [Anaerorhabdus furcosa]SJZ65508.1 dihydroxyacetone kinase, C-terminal domain [Anaerorhabdus furcosa]